MLIEHFYLRHFAVAPALRLRIFHRAENIGSVLPFISSMNKLAEQNLAERTPSRWVEWLFHSHPAIARRVAAAEAWAKAKS